MTKPKRSLLLHSGGKPFHYALTREGEHWTEKFDSFEEAVEHAGTIVKEKTPLLIFNESGELLLTSSASPVGSRDPREKKDVSNHQRTTLRLKE